MRVFEEATIEVLNFNVEDVITASADVDENAGAEDEF